jgi:hypothetical protein
MKKLTELSSGLGSHFASLHPKLCGTVIRTVKARLRFSNSLP